MNLIKKVYSKLYKTKNFFMSFCASRYLRLRTKPLENNVIISGSFLILVPHADDEWVGCGGLFEDNNNKITLCYMNMPGGDSKEIHAQRYMELSQMAKIKDVHLLHLDGNEEQKVEKLKKIIEKTKPEHICVPSCYDWHLEHLAVIKMLKKSLLNNNVPADLKILTYQVSVPMPENIINAYSPISKIQQKEKWALFRQVYKTQDFFPVERFMHNEYVSGGIAGSYSAEVYCSMNYKDWITFVEKNTVNETQRKELEKCFKNLIKVRGKVKDFSINNNI